jgi:glutamate-ammonia-ligase adenylyltransferase
VGKLGGRELSYGSDLDIFFVYSEPGSLAPPTGLTVFEYFSKVAEKTISYLSTLTREGFVFRVDTRLRPTGSKGPLVQSVDAFNNYYSSQAETWELQALLRARCVAGDRAVGETFCRVIQELIYRDMDRATLADDITSMRRRMESEVGRESEASYNIKQGAGGLVDIEFLVQYLQLLYGKQHKRVRVPGTYNALRALKRQELLDEATYRTLMRAYLFLRQLESRLRIVSNQATNELSRDPAKLLPLAQRMGYLADGPSAGQMLLDDYYLMSRQVRNIFDKLLSYA